MGLLPGLPRMRSVRMCYSSPNAFVNLLEPELGHKMCDITMLRSALGVKRMRESE